MPREEKEVLRLQVSVADFVPVTVVNCLDDLSEYMTSFIFLENPCINNLIKELAALTKFHDDVNISVIFKRFKHFAYIRVIKILQYFNFN